MKYLKKFQTNADYQAFKESSDWITPNLSAIEETNTALYASIQVSMPTFQIINNDNTLKLDWSSITLEFEDGMTWNQWINSKYNTINAFLYDNGDNLFVEIKGTNGYNGLLYASSTSTANSMRVFSNAKLTDGKIYYINSSMCCFVEGTQVLTSLDGETRNIEDLKTGDTVISYSTERDENYESTVKGQYLNTKSIDMAKVTCADGTVLEMTDYHPLYTNEGWKSLTNFNGYETLKVGDIVKTVDDWSEITSIERYSLQEPITTYTINVIDKNEEIDNDINDGFYANGVLAHNAASPC